MKQHKTSMVIYYIVAFFWLLGLGLFHYYDATIMRAIAFKPYYTLYFIIRILIQYITPILLILICYHIEKKDTSQNLIIPSVLSGGLIVMLVIALLFNMMVILYWLIGCSIVTAFCLINIMRKCRNRT